MFKDIKIQLLSHIVRIRIALCQVEEFADVCRCKTTNSIKIPKRYNININRVYSGVGEVGGNYTDLSSSAKSLT